eukprot:Lankesteria_metandrocarpae@DN10552_c0_g1_i1.p1
MNLGRLNTKNTPSKHQLTLKNIKDTPAITVATHPRDGRRRRSALGDSDRRPSYHQGHDLSGSRSRSGGYKNHGVTATTTTTSNSSSRGSSSRSSQSVRRRDGSKRLKEGGKSGGRDTAAANKQDITRMRPPRIQSNGTGGGMYEGRTRLH